MASGSPRDVAPEIPGCRRRQARTQTRRGHRRRSRWSGGISRVEDAAWRRSAPGRSGAMLRGGPLVAALPAELAEVELAERLFDEAPLVVGIERLAGHLLGGQDREVCDLGADLLDRA